MPQNPYALGGLQSALGLPVPGSALADPDELAALGPEGAEYLRKARMRDELKNRLFNEQRAPLVEPTTPAEQRFLGSFSPGPSIATQQANKAGETQALAGLIGSLGEDTGEPGTAPSSALGIQRQRLAADAAANAAAQRAGFGGTGFQATPSGQQAAFARSLEQTKALSPLSIAQTTQGAETERQRMRGEQELALEQERQKGIGKQVELMRTMGEMAPGTSMSFGRGVSVKTPGAAAVPGQLGKDFDTELGRLTELVTKPSMTDTQLDKAAQSGLGKALGLSTIQDKIQRHIANLDAIRPGWRNQIPANSPLSPYLKGVAGAHQPAASTAPSALSGGGDQALRSQAMKILQDAGEMTTENNIMHVVGLLQQQQ